MSDMQIPHGTFCWHELMTRDTDAATRFYTELFGWSSSVSDIGATKYTLFAPAGAKDSKESIAGMMAITGPEFEGVPPNWLSYVAVEDIAATTERVTKLGGQVRVPVTPIPTIGKFAVIADPTGAVIALFQR